MKLKSLIAAAALATMSTAAAADNVTTASGDVVMVEKNQSAMLGFGQIAPFALGLIIIAAASAGGSD
ncbi:hypothetical protein [Thalassorhabdomicrobium marinisediminis]|uniref:Ferrochelatase n=1 Tax=Thalassorhabdomicrobium marinisediminis TaxID=2170577 RepID=A0A2T7G087_9RHOB|nr:hypothetical protein [Thalassorhabdomicrobium marinisediminis]PVA07815.1 hypothetical protein DC363_04115 [Thalassorhabdomicrobium marinisediminis]